MSEKQGVHLRADDVQESFKLGFEGVKHLTTLNAGSFVLTATFLKDIFPKKQDGSLALDPFDEFLIGISFVFFAASLTLSAFSLWGLATLLRSRRLYQEKTLRFRLYIGLPAFFFVSGLSCFGTTVLITVLELSQAAALILYVLLGVLVVGSAGYIVRRTLKVGRETPITYIIDYS
jgi:hypothetical protein